MTDLDINPVAHDHDAFLKKSRKRNGFTEAYDDLEVEYSLIRELLAARARAGLTQEQVAEAMGTTKSAISRLEAAPRHSPSLTTLKKYAQAVGCGIELHLVPLPRKRGKAAKQRRNDAG